MDLIVDNDMDRMSANHDDITRVAYAASGSSEEVVSVDSTVPLGDASYSFFEVSPQEGSAETKNTVDDFKQSLLDKNINQNMAFNAEHIVNLEAQTLVYHSTGVDGFDEKDSIIEKNISVIDENIKDEENSEEVDGERLSNLLTFTNSSQKEKPGVILLGRGNSFSLGRSEVMLLHANRRNKSDAGRTGNRNYRHLVTGLDNSNNNNNSTESISNRNLNMFDSLVNTRAQRVSDRGMTPDELESLWRKAEVVMAAKQVVVQEVLEEFGIAEPGRVGEGTLDKAMEETIWQAVQDSFQI
ncbi:unnamed protein product [Candidula unifasciata]|uniref:Uncharacterized protein n=1 Tax=Candidula unifasciata TaxID=100452 RepID=A0A8S3Z1F2_9EUPU|nr:unnamed protein product [Candidula unifasciata]